MRSWQRHTSVTPRNASRACSTGGLSHTSRRTGQRRAAGPQNRRVARRDFVGRQHFADHFVVRLVGVERLDDPIPPPPNVWLAFAYLGSIAVPIAIAPDVHPMPAPTLAVLRARQQAIHDTLISVRGQITRECTQFGRRGRKSHKIQVHAPQEHVFRRWRTSAQSVAAAHVPPLRLIDGMRSSARACTPGSTGRAGG